MVHRVGHEGAFVGREPELRTLGELLDDALRGRGHVALVLGEPGIGKSALVETLATTATERSLPVGWGRCAETDAPAFWPWRQALRAIGVDALNDASTTTSRPEMFARVVEQLAEIDRPAMLALEDLHWADPASLALLRFVADAARGLPLLVVATTRDDPADAGPEATTLLQSLPPGVERLALSGLAADAVAEVVAAELDQGPGEDLADRIAERCGGNPFFAREVARLHAIRGADATPSVPAAVQQVLERRLSRLGGPCRTVLAAAAVAGEPDPELLAEVVGEPRAAVQDQLGEGVTARLLFAEGARLRFAHALVRETLYAQQSPATLGDLHRRVAEAIETRPTAAGTDAARLAAHWRRAGGQDARAKAAAHALAAAREARERLGYEQAAHYYEWALEAPPDDVLMLRIEQGEAQVLAGTMATGRDTLRQAAHDALRADRPRDAARAVLGIGVGGFEVMLRDDDQVAMLDRALDGLVSPGDDALRAAVLARLSVASTWQRPADARAELAEESVPLARAAGDTATEVAALAAWCDARSGPDHIGERLDRSGRMIDIARPSGDPTALLLARRLRLVALAERGDFAAVDAEIDDYARTSDRLRLPLYAWPVPVWRGARAVMSGDVDAARHHLAEAEALAERAGSANAAMVTVILKVTMFSAAGDADAFAAGVDEVRRVTVPYYGEPDTLAFLYAAAGRQDEARRVLHRRASAIDRPRDAEYISELWQLAEASVLLAETNVAATVYEALQPYADLWAIGGIFGGCMGHVSHALGRLAYLLDEPDEARSRLSRAREAHAAVGADHLVAQTDAALAQLADPPRGARMPAASTSGDGSGMKIPEGTGQPEGEFRRSGRIWHLRWDGSTATVPDTKGMRDLAALLATPGSEVHVLDLVEAAGGPDAAAAGGHAGERLDKAARTAYRQRLTDIEEELAEAEAGSDAARADKLRHEKEFLAAELAGALGLRGRARTQGDPVERARKAVAMRIRTALKAIAEVDPALARHLDRSVTTGRLCSYRPEHEVRWRL